MPFDGFTPAALTLMLTALWDSGSWVGSSAANASGASMNAILKAQMLSTALDVYFGTPSLGGNKIGAATPLGGVKINQVEFIAPQGAHESATTPRPYRLSGGLAFL
jgi:hypothetical protein